MQDPSTFRSEFQQAAPNQQLTGQPGAAEQAGAYRQPVDPTRAGQYLPTEGFQQPVQGPVSTGQPPSGAGPFQAPPQSAQTGSQLATGRGVTPWNVASQPASRPQGFAGQPATISQPSSQPQGFAGQPGTISQPSSQPQGFAGQPAAGSQPPVASQPGQLETSSGTSGLQHATQRGAGTGLAQAGLQQPSMTPAVDVVNAPDEVSVFVDLPGCERDDIQVHASDDRLRIVAKRRSEAEDEQTIQRERPSDVERIVQLPSRTNTDEAEAAYEDGVLKITLPKREEDREKTIGIQ